MLSNLWFYPDCCYLFKMTQTSSSKPSTSTHSISSSAFLSNNYQALSRRNPILDRAACVCLSYFNQVNEASRRGGQGEGNAPTADVNDSRTTVVMSAPVSAHKKGLLLIDAWPRHTKCAEKETKRTCTPNEADRKRGTSDRTMFKCFRANVPAWRRSVRFQC